MRFLHQCGDVRTVVNTKFFHQRDPCFAHRLVQHNGSIRIGNGAVKSPRGNPEDISAAVQPDTMKWLLPGRIHEIKGTPPADRQQIVFLMGMHIKLPGTGFEVIWWTHGGACVNHKIPRIRRLNGDVEKTNRWGVAKTLIGEQFEHGRQAGQDPKSAVVVPALRRKNSRVDNDSATQVGHLGMG